MLNNRHLCFLFSLLIISLTSAAQVGLVAGWVGSKINDKTAWNKFRKEQTVSNAVLNGDTLFCLRTSSEGLNQLAGSNKYRELSAAIRSLEGNLATMQKQVLDGKYFDNRLITYTDELIEQVVKKDKGVDVAYYRKEQAFYTRYQANYASRQKAIADSMAAAKQAASEKAKAAAANEPSNTSSGTVIYGGLDSAYVVTMYGSIKEYNEQYHFMQKSSHKHLVLFAGKNSGWLNELIAYFERTKGWWVHGYGGVEGARKFTMRGGCYGCNENNWPRVDITMHYDTTTGIIKKMVLTGKNMEIERLFIDYWDIADIKYDQLSAKGIFYHDVFTDKISLVSKPTGSTITITANPKVSMGK